MPFTLRCTLNKDPQLLSKYIWKYIIKEPNQMAVDKDLDEYLSILSTSQTKYSEPLSQGLILTGRALLRDKIKKNKKMDGKIFCKNLHVKFLSRIKIQFHFNVSILP